MKLQSCGLTSFVFVIHFTPSPHLGVRIGPVGFNLDDHVFGTWDGLHVDPRGLGHRRIATTAIGAHHGILAAALCDGIAAVAALDIGFLAVPL